MPGRTQDRNRRVQRRRWELYCFRRGGVPNLGWHYPRTLAKVLKFDPDFRPLNLVGLPLEELMKRLKDAEPGSALWHALQRVIQEVDKPTDAVAGWNAAIG